MTTSTGRLRLALEVRSVARLDAKSPTTSEAPAAARAAVPVCEAGTRGLSTPHRLRRYEDADMAERTRTYGLSDSGTQDTAVKITPATHQGPVTSTPTVA